MSSVVYIVSIGKNLKVGYTTNLGQRIKAFRTSTAEEIEVLATFPGGRKEERRLHDSLAESRMHTGEFFHRDYRINNFIDFINAGDLEKAWRWLDETHIDRRRRRRAEERQARVAARRQTKAEFDAYIAGLVAERKRTLGW